MISASSLNAASSPHGHSLSNKSSPMPLALENGRLRVDSQKFLVPSLPVSSRAINGNTGDSSGKRRERSIVNGTAIPSENHHRHHQNHHSNHHHNLGLHSPNLNGLRHSSSYNHNIQNHTGNHNGSPANGQHHLSPHYSSAHLNTSPRKDAHSPMYAGEVSNPGNYPGRSSMPIPCSSPSPASSASPKSLNQSHSPNASVSPSSRNYSSPQLPATSILPSGVNVSNLVPDLSSLSSTANRLYPGGFHGLGTHPGAPPPPHLSSAFYAAAAAAAAHSIPYPLFGAHHYSHAAGTYLDSFHSNLLVPPSLRSPSGSSNSSQQSPRSHSSYLQQHQQHLGVPMSHSTTTTSLHTKLIESVSTSNERHNHSHHHQQQQQQHRDLHGHSHGHMNSTNSHSQQQQNYNRYLANGIPGMAKGGPLGIGMGIGATVPNLPPPALPVQHKVSHSDNSNKSSVNGSSSSSKMWIDSASSQSSLLNSSRDGNVTPTESNGKETDANKDANKVPLGKEGSLKHRILTRSPDDLTATISPKVSKSISFAEFNGSHSHNHSSSLSNGRSHHHSERSTSNSYSQMNGYHHQQHPHYPSGAPTSVSGVLVDSNNAKHGNTNNGKHSANNNNNNNNPFLPPSPKKRSAPWNFAVPPTKIDLPPPQPVATHSNQSSFGNSGESKYLSQNQKPSNQYSNPNSPYLSPTAQQQSNPNSPVAKFNGDSITANSPGKSQNTTKENGRTKANGNKERNSSSSSSNSDSSTGTPLPVEAMPVLNAFKRGSLIQLANGELRPVEDLQTDDFLQAAAITSEATKIIHCTVLSIAESASQLCKVTLTMGSLKQQVVMESTPEQPFFVLGRGWSSSSPLTTQKLLQLPCTPLAVGDVCITLSRVKNGLKTSHQLPPKSPCIKTKGGGGAPKGRNGNTASSSTAKNSRLSANNNNSSPTAATTNKLSRKAAMNNIGNGKSSGVSATMSNGGNLSSAMLPPPSPLSLTAPKSSMNNSLPVGPADENERPPSPKKRRWSAPVDNVPDVDVDKDNLTKKENPTVRIKT